MNYCRDLFSYENKFSLSGKLRDLWAEHAWERNRVQEQSPNGAIKVLRISICLKIKKAIARSWHHLIVEAKLFQANQKKKIKHWTSRENLEIIFWLMILGRDAVFWQSFVNPNSTYITLKRPHLRSHWMEKLGIQIYLSANWDRPSCVNHVYSSIEKIQKRLPRLLVVH